MNQTVKDSVAGAIFLLLTATGPALGQQPAPPVPQPGAPSQPGAPGEPQQPGVPGQPGQPGVPEPRPEAPPITEVPVAPAQRDPGSAAGVVPEDLVPAEQPTLVRPPTFLGPDLFNPPVPRGWITVTPTFTLSGEYNDNIFNSSSDRTSDFIIGLVPGVTLSVQRPEYRLLAGYNLTSEIFVSESEQSEFAKRHDLFADGFYLLSPRTRLTLRERFVYDEDTSIVSSGGESAGRRNALRNTLTLGVNHQLTELTLLRAAVSQTHVQFDGDTTARDSDTFRLLVGADHQFTGRLTGTADFDSAYVTVQGESDAYPQRARLGFDYRITQTLTGGLSAGPSILIRDDDVHITPAISARVTQLFRFGSLRAGYDRSVTATTFGLADRHTIYATLGISQLVRGLRLDVTPRYTIEDHEFENGGATDRKVDVVSLNLRLTYQLTTSLSAIGCYTFRHQSESNGRNEDIDQNRVFLGVQYAFPITVY